jgi:ribosomal protein S18 acetylase RimI-like enzyme
MSSLMLASGHGVVELLYDGLLPGRALTDVLIERRFLNPQSFAHLSNWRVACLEGDKVAGAVCALPFSNYSSLPGDPLITAERLAPIRELITLEDGLAGAFCLTNIAVHPEARGHGIGKALLADTATRAAAAGFDRIGLSTFGDDPAAMGFYVRAGFRVIGTRAMQSHPRVEAQGHWAILDWTFPPQSARGSHGT